MKASVVIIGAGGHSRVLFDALRLSGAEVMGCVAKELPETLPEGLKYLGGDDLLAAFDRKRILLANGIGSVSKPALRSEIFRRFSADGYRFVTVVHPSAVVASDVIAAEGVQIMAGVIVQPGCRLGDGVLLNTGAIVDHDCEIGRHTHIAPGAVLSGGVKVGESCHLGTGSRVIQGVSIGDCSVIGAGSVVLGDVGSEASVAGVPARPIERKEISGLL